MIDEIFVRFLFASVFNSDINSLMVNLKIKPKSDRSEGSKQLFGAKSKEQAYRLLNSLIRKSPALMKSFLTKGMSPLMALIKKQQVWNY